MWAPDLHEGDGPIYERIAAALERDIAAGRLAPGARLPTLKELAAALGVTPGTINRAYELAQRRGLIDGEVGRGTFVRGAAPIAPPARPVIDADATIDLAIVKPNLALQEPHVRAAMLELAQSPQLADMLDYTPDGGHPLHREAGAAWMRAAGLVDARAEQVLLTAGAQHGLWVAVHALTRPGDLVLCEALCYPGIAAVVLALGRRIRGVALDGEGMDPADLRALCENERPALVICIATCQNPTTRVMSAGRRAQVAALAREFDFTLVDDDLYGFLAPEPQPPIPPLATFAPERTLYLTSLSKSVSSTMRLGYLHGPAEWLAKLAASVRTSVWMVSPLAAQIATTLITSGRAAAMAAAQREEARARQLIARELLGRFGFDAQPCSFQLWLELPPHWAGGEQFAALARSHRLLLAGGDAFAVNRDGQGHRHVRIALMAGTREQLRFVLSKLAGLIETAEASWL